MEQYIPKSALVAEIDRQIELLKPFLGACAGQIVAEANAKLSVLEGLKIFLNTLEVKEVDLRKELNTWRHNHFHGRRDRETSGEYLERVTQLELAKHFFELGLAASNPLTAKDIENIYHLVNKVADELGIRAMYVDTYKETLRRFKAQKGEEV